MKSDPERVESVAQILREGIPGADQVTHNDPSDGGPVVFAITWLKTGAAAFRVTPERFQEDQDETERLVREEAIPVLHPGASYILTFADGLIPFGG